MITTYVYNKRGQVTAKTQSASGQARNIGYAYDSVGRITQIGYPSGRIINYTYVGGKVNSVAVGTTTLVSGITHAPFGPVTGWTWGSGAAHPRAVDTDYRYSSMKVGTGTETLIYDNAGNLATITHATVNQFNRTLGYDVLDRLTSETGTGYSRNWTWDANGNRLTAKYNSTTCNYTYVSGKNRLNTVSGPTARTYTYDAAGNIATNGASGTIGRTAYTYNARGRLVTTATRTSSTATASVTHYYNALGQRVRKTGADGTVNFIYDEAGHLVGEFNGSNALIQETAWLDDTPIAMLTGTSTVQYIHADHLNTPRVITNTAGTMQWWWNADSFGHQGLNEDVDGNGTKVTYNPRFPGQYYDTTVATNYNYFRDYDSITGRYIQSDPIGLAGGINTYGYGAGNPLRYSDPFGLYTEFIIWQPIGWGSSSFGHVSANVNGQNYSWGPGGWDTVYSSAAAYAERQQQFRSGMGVVLGLTPSQERELIACLTGSHGDYDTITDNCATPFKDCLNLLGLGVGYPLFPADFGDALLNSPLNQGVKPYPGPARGFIDNLLRGQRPDAPWAR